MAAYGVDSLDPAVTPRRVAVLLSHLPPSARGGGDAWSTEAELLAYLADQVAALTWVTMKAHGAKNARKPQPLPRPGARPRAAPAAPAPQGRPAAAEPVKHPTWAEAAAALAGMPGMRAGRG